LQRVLSQLLEPAKDRHMTEAPPRTTTVDFDHHSPDMPENNWNVFAELRSKCPVAYTDAHNGFWMISGHDDVQSAARDDDTFSSVNDLDRMLGIALPEMPAKAGIIETDPPYFLHLRRRSSRGSHPAPPKRGGPTSSRSPTTASTRSSRTAVAI
jgi:cytochrome P450